MRAEMIVRHVKGPDVLDVGCTGHVPDVQNPYWVHGHLRKAFPSVWGIDKEADNVRRLRALGYSNVRVADAQSFDLEKRFDTIVAGELIEHLENPGAFLVTASEHLKPDGRIVLTTPYPFGLAHLLYAWFKFPRTCSNPQHTLWLCPTTLQSLAARAGLKVVHWQLLFAFQPSLSRRYDLLMRALRFLPTRVKANAMLFLLARNIDHRRVGAESAG